MVFFWGIIPVSYSQKITANQESNGVSVKWQDKKMCKYLFIQKKSNQCNKPILFYTPVYSCNGKKISKKKRLHLNFKDEIPVLREMMDSARQFMMIDLCMVNFNLNDYDDLYSRLIDKFAGNTEWQKSVQKRGMKNGKPDFDYGLVLKVIRDEGVLDPLDEFLNIYGFRVSRAQFTEDDLQVVPKKDLKRLGKDENLIIPLPHPLWAQLSIMPK